LAKLDDIHSHQYRQLLCGMYRIIYEVRQDVVYIHLIVDTRRDLSALLLRRLVRVGTNCDWASITIADRTQNRR
jgi:hypothetical protein